MKRRGGNEVKAGISKSGKGGGIKCEGQFHQIEVILRGRGEQSETIGAVCFLSGFASG